MPKKLLSIVTAIFLICFVVPSNGSAAKKNEQDIYAERIALYKKMEAITNVPWYYLAAVDQYERSVRSARRDRPDADGPIGIYYSKSEWAGATNPNPDDKNPLSISIFGGTGKDGNGDGFADIENDEDVLYTFADHLASYGYDFDSFTISIWDHYHRDQAVNIIAANAKLFKHFNRLDLNDHAFPMPIRYNYSYNNTWGDRRGWGGLRIHEGTDIFADHGVPVRATTYGVIEMKGWNRYGGWRIGIRDIHNNYHYFAHMRGFADGIKEGQIVEPGTVIGYVGSSGYGKPGTQGKFPPHLHYGIYKDNGITEWSYDPYPKLRVWERQARQKKK